MLEHVINKSTKSDFVSKIKYSDSDDHKKKKDKAQSQDPAAQYYSYILYKRRVCTIR